MKKLSGVLLIAALTIAAAVPASSMAAFPTDEFANEVDEVEPLYIMRVGQALDSAGAISEVPVATVDTGIDLQHPELAPRLAPAAAGSDFIGNDCNGPPPALAPDNNPDDPVACSGHGSLVAGTLGAAWNNGLGGAGVAPNARFLPIRSCFDNDNCFGDIQPAAMNFAANLGARVVTASWNPIDYTGDPGGAAAMQGAIASHPNTLFIANSSGNGDEVDADAQASSRWFCGVPLPNVLCVTVAANDDSVCGGAFGDSLVDVAVPVQNMYWTDNDTDGTFYNGTDANCFQSVSPTISGGVATILFGAFPQATGAQVRNAIIAGARPSAEWSGKNVSGGVIDALGAYNALKAQFPGAAAPPPAAPAGPTGLRAKAKKKCKKRKGKARRKCLKKAKKLPL